MRSPKTGRFTKAGEASTLTPRDPETGVFTKVTDTRCGLVSKGSGKVPEHKVQRDELGLLARAIAQAVRWCLRHPWNPMWKRQPGLYVFSQDGRTEVIRVAEEV